MSSFDPFPRFEPYSFEPVNPYRFEPKKYEPPLVKYEPPLVQLPNPYLGPGGFPPAGPGLRLGPPGNPMTW
jgi:hypothetical protein